MWEWCHDYFHHEWYKDPRAAITNTPGPRGKQQPHTYYTPTNMTPRGGGTQSAVAHGIPLQGICAVLIAIAVEVCPMKRSMTSDFAAYEIGVGDQLQRISD